MRQRRRNGARALMPFASMPICAVLFGAVVSLVAGARGAAGATAPPQNVQPPSIEGVAQEGRVLRADRGKWRPAPGRGVSFAYQWRLCDAGGAACVDVARATDTIYAVRHEDVGHTLRVVVTPLTDASAAPAGAKAVSAVSAPTRPLAPVANDAPLVTVRPAIAGAPTVGTVLTAQAGTWGGAQPIRVRYRWRICDMLGGSCRDVGRKADTYALRAADLGHSLRVLVTGRNAVAATAALSDPTAPVTAASGAIAPKATAEPAIGGTSVVGQVLRATSGTWTGTPPLRFTYHWRRCQGAGKPDASDCRNIARAPGAAYTVRRADLGARLRVQVTATNGAGSATSTSNPTAVVTAPPPQKVAPKATAEPGVSGTPRVGQVLRLTRGRWVGTKPISFAFRWVRCGPDGGAPDGSNCAAIPGATGTSYRLAHPDAGARLRALVTATNAAGSQTAASNATREVQAAPAPAPAPPRNTREPSIVGKTTEGQMLAASGGTWSGAQPIGLTFQWVRCGADGGKPDGSNCPAIPGATTPKYALGSGDVGHRLRVRVTAKNAGGTVTVASNPTATIGRPAAPPGPPRDTREPSIAGPATQGATVRASSGTWAGASPISLTFQWVRCGAGGGKPDGSNCAAIPGATTPKYVLAAADVGKRLRVRVTAKNARGTYTVASNATPPIISSEALLPAGGVKLPNGKYSIPVSSVALPARLVVNGVSFTPNPVRNRRTDILLRVHVVDTRGFVVRNALVFARSTPLVTVSAGERRTAMDGWVTIRLVPRATFPIRNGYNVQFFVRARKPGDNVLAGVSTRRLVQVPTHR
jgi:fibronectin-binding autotransporter adhesin